MVRHVVVTIVFLLSVTNVNTRDALEYFVEHKKIHNFTMEILKNEDNSSSTWVEYKYIFSANTESVTENFNNSTLRVGLLIDDNNTFDCAIFNESNITGYSVDIVETLRKHLSVSNNIEYEVIHTQENLASLLQTEIDILVCHPSTERFENLTEVYPTIKTNYLLVYKPNNLSFTKDIFIRTFAGYLWLVFVIFLVALALCLRISTTQYSLIHPTYEPWTWVEITLWAIAAACQQGLSHTPSGFASCLIFFLGYLTAYLLYTGFAAAITSILVRNEVDSNFNVNYIEKNAGNLKLVCLRSSRAQLTDLRLQFLITKYVDNLDELFEQLEGMNRIGVAPELFVKQYIARNFNYEQAASFLTSKLEYEYTKGFLISTRNPWRKEIDKQVLRLKKTGVLQNILERNLKPDQVPDLNSGYSSAGREHVCSALLLFLAGVLASIIFLSMEFILYLYQRSKNHLGL